MKNVIKVQITALRKSIILEYQNDCVQRRAALRRLDEAVTHLKRIGTTGARDAQGRFISADDAKKLKAKKKKSS